MGRKTKCSPIQKKAADTCKIATTVCMFFLNNLKTDKLAKMVTVTVTHKPANSRRLAALEREYENNSNA